MGARARLLLVGVALVALPVHAATRPAAKPGKKTTTVVVGPKHTAEEAPVPPEGDRNRERVMRMQEALREILNNASLRRARIGIKVMDAGTGRLFFEKRGATLMDPASNQKVLASATALMRLGSEWRFRTELSGHAPDNTGAIDGDVFLRGSGDPTIRTRDLEALAARLARQGVRRIDGGVVADPRRLASDESVAAVAENSGRPSSRAEGGDDLGGPVSSRAPLIVNHGFIVVRIHPGAGPKAPAEVMTNPSDESFVVRNLVSTKPNGRSRVTVRVSLAEGRMRVDVAGTIAANHPGLVFRRRVPHPALHAAVLFRAALTSAGILVRDRPRAGIAPAAGIELLDSHESAPLGVLLHKINKDSDNDQAERVLEAAGAEVYGGAATPAKGIALLREVIGELGLRPASYVPKNGSGLFHVNRITPEAMARLLRTLYLDPRIGPEILQSLSVGGVDGTTRNRFKNTPAAKRVRAKTGTLNGKSCLSGFVGDGGDVVVFSIMVDGMRSRTLGAVRGAQVGAVNAMMRYVREGTGERVELPTEILEPPVRDFESGEEIMESEGEATESGVSTSEDPIDAVQRQTRQDRQKEERAAPAAPAPAPGVRPQPKPDTPLPQTP